MHVLEAQRRTDVPDKFTKEKRSEIMSKIRSKGTKIELEMKKALEEQSIQFQYQPKTFGNPDFLIRPNVIVFCDSSFWHGRDWSSLRKRLPQGYWREHIKRNRKRDRLVNAHLKKRNYAVLRFWDYQIEKQIDRCVERIRKTVSSQSCVSDV
jgi:DNA mismatch endonuclease (patch repair protein)